MATMVEKTGKTVEEAINEALEELGVTSEEVIIEVIIKVIVIVAIVVLESPRSIEDLIPRLPHTRRAFGL